MIRRLFDRVVRWADRHWLEFFSIGAVSLLAIIVLWPLIVHTVPAGHVGVLWLRFFGGTVTEPDDILGEGFHVIWPWDKIYDYDARLQRIDEQVTGLSVDGLSITVDLASRFVIRSEYAGFLHKSLGPGYADSLMRPQLRTLVLTYISEHEAADLYSTRRAKVQNTIARQFQESLAHISANVPFDDSYIDLEDVLISEIGLPPFVRQAIEEKEKVRHMSEAYDFRLLLEDKERRRKRIEAEGIRAFQEIVAPGITESYLRWRGIEATLELSRSNNAKVVIIGSNADGLPVILNTDSGQTLAPGADAAAAAAAPPATSLAGPLTPPPPEPLNDGVSGIIRSLTRGTRPAPGIDAESPDAAPPATPAQGAGPAIIAPSTQPPPATPPTPTPQ